MVNLLNPLDNKNVRWGSKPADRMMKRIMTGDFSRKGWSRQRNEALEDIMIEYLPLYIVEQKNKRVAAAAKAQDTKLARGVLQIAGHKAAVTRKQRQLQEQRRLAADITQVKQNRQEAARKAAETRRKNKEALNKRVE